MIPVNGSSMTLSFFLVSWNRYSSSWMLSIRIRATRDLAIYPTFFNLVNWTVGLAKYGKWPNCRPDCKVWHKIWWATHALSTVAVDCGGQGTYANAPPPVKNPGGQKGQNDLFGQNDKMMTKWPPWPPEPLTGDTYVGTLPPAIRRHCLSKNMLQSTPFRSKIYTILLFAFSQAKNPHPSISSSLHLFSPHHITPNLHQFPNMHQPCWWYEAADDRYQLLKLKSWKAEAEAVKPPYETVQCRSFFILGSESVRKKGRQLGGVACAIGKCSRLITLNPVISCDHNVFQQRSSMIHAVYLSFFI